MGAVDPIEHNEQRPILVGIPCGDMVHSQFMMSLGMMIARSAAVDQLWIAISCIQGTILDSSRDMIAQHAINMNASHLLFLDSDMMFPAETLSVLLSHNLPLVGATYSMRREPFALTHRTVHDGSSSFESPASYGLLEVQSVGLGCMLIQTEVLRAFEEEKPIFRVERTHRLKGEVSEDVYFFREACKLGFRAYVDVALSRRVSHLGTKAFSIHDVKSIRRRDDE